MKLFAVILLVLAGTAGALSPVSAVVYVRYDSPGPTFDGNSWDTAYHAIQDGLDDAAVAGEEVRVARGTYVEQIVLKSGVALKGGYSGVGDARDIRANLTIVDGGQVGGGYAVTGANTASIDGFTVCGGDYAVFCSSTSPTISHNVVMGSALCGVYCISSSALILNNMVIANDTGIACDICSPTITNNTVVGNDDIGISLSPQSHPTIYNNIVAYNSTGIYKWSSSGDTAPTLSRNDVYGNTSANYVGVAAGSGDISSDPQFMSLSAGNLHIQSTSPCRNAGTTSAPGMSSTDIDGQARVEGTTVDIGADESYGETSPGSTRVVYVKASAAPGGDGTSWATAYDTIQAAVDDASSHGGGEVWAAKGIYNEHVTMRSFVALYGGFAGTETQRSSRIPFANKTIVSARDVTLPAVVGANQSVIDGFVIRGGCHGVSCYYTSPTISNNIIAGNGKTGMHCLAGAAVVTNNTIVGNDVGVSCDNASPRIYSNIVAFNRAGVTKDGGAPILSCNDVYGNTSANYVGLSAGAGDISSDPRFASFSQGDLHIQATSPCRNAGNNSAPGLPSHDMDGQARVYGSTVDMGADESYGETYTVPTRILRVNAAASSSGDGSSWPSAYNTIQAAIDDISLNGGAEVWAARGTYWGQITLPPFTQLYGGFAGIETTRAQRDPKANETVINAGGEEMSVPAVRPWSVSTLDGFVVTGGFIGVGSDFGSPTFANNVICGNEAYGVVCGSSALVTTNLIFGNGNGVACVSGRPTVSLNRISGNGACGVTSGSTSVIAGNIISGNAAGVLCDYLSPTVTNNTIVANSAYGIIYDYASSPSINNNISCWNSYGIYNDIGTYATPGNTWGTPTLRYNDFYGNSGGNYSQVSPGTGDISADPLLASVQSGNYHIQYTSPCRNAAYNSASGKPTVDIDGQARTNEGTVDIGADETYGETYPSPYPARIIRVNAAAPPGGNGETWATAYNSIQTAMRDAWWSGGAEVWAAGGTYRESVVMAPLTCLYGGFDGTEMSRSFRNPASNVTTIDATSAGDAAAVVCPGSGVIDGFTVRGGAAGIIAETGSSTVSDNVVCAVAGPGITCGADARVVNCLVIGNSSGISCVSGSPTVVNNTIADNSQSGFSFAYGSSPTFANSISAFNSLGVATSPAPLSTTMLSFNNVYGNTASDYSGCSPGGWDIPADPQFADRGASDYHLLADSPAIDAGDSGGDVWMYDDFNSYLDGNLAGQGPWTGTPGYVRIESAFAKSGKAAEADCKSWGFGEVAALTDSGSGYHFIDLDAAMDTSGAAYGTSLGYLKLFGPTGKEITRLFLSHQQLKVLLGPANPVPIMENVPSREWQHVRLGIDPAAGVMDVWVNGVRKVTSGATYKIEPSITRMTYGQWNVATSFTKTETYIDNLRCQVPSSGTGIAPDTDLEGLPRPLDGTGAGMALVDIGCYEFLRNQMSIASAKAKADSTPVGITGPVSTACFDDRFYVENQDGSCGIGVLGSLSSAGKRVTVEGVMTTVDGERMVTPSLISEGSDATIPRAPLLSHPVLGGGPFGAQEGITGSGGLNNIGLLVTIFGRMTEIEEPTPPAQPSWFKVNDGSNLNVKCLVPEGVTIDENWDYLRVVGISSCEIAGDELHRLLRVRALDDITPILP